MPLSNSIVNCRLREERGDEERGGSDVEKMRGQSPRASPGHSPVLNLSKSGNEPNSAGEASERSELHSPNPSMREDDDNVSEGNVSEVDEANDKDEDDGELELS
jgi:hypothetical protein